MPANCRGDRGVVPFNLVRSVTMLLDRFRRTVPWRLADLYLLVGCSAVGLGLIGAARAAVAGRSTLAEQIPWLNAGVAGLILLALGDVLWLLAGRRAVGDLRRNLLGRVRAQMSDAIARPDLDRDDDSFVVAPGLTRYHRADCMLIAGKAVQTVATIPDELRPCGVCSSGPAS